jgi:hypothetical protein
MDATTVVSGEPRNANRGARAAAGSTVDRSTAIDRF